MDIKPKNLLKRVLQFARDELERRAGRQDDDTPDVVDDAPRAEAAREPVNATGQVSGAPAAVAPADEARVTGLEVTRPRAGLLALRWAVTKAEVARAEAQLAGNPVLCVRVVTFSKGRDAVLREVQDRPGVDLTGDCEISEPPSRAVVSLGLRAGDRFVSIAHHVI
jgi:hypothetical protein